MASSMSGLCNGLVLPNASVLVLTFCTRLAEMPNMAMTLKCKQLLCLTLHVCAGSCVPKSQNLTVVSPDPLAKRLPSGLKFTDSTASAWPGMDAVHLLTGRTLKMACGWYTMCRAVSTDTYTEAGDTGLRR